MVKSIGYKQFIVYKDKMPNSSERIFDLSKISKIQVTKHKDKKYSSIEEFMKHSKNIYSFFMITKSKTTSKYFKHIFQYKNLEMAEKAYKKIRLKKFDQDFEKYLTKIQKGSELTLKEKDEINALMKQYDESIFTF